MKKIILFVIILISFSTCKSSKQVSRRKPSNYSKQANQKKASNSKKINATPKKNISTKKTKNSKSDNIVNYAKQFKGVKYKWGGTTKSGMDCSGLVFTSFKSANITLPRISRDMAKKGQKIALNSTKEGDLLFFKTGNKRNSINHVGLVVSNKSGVIQFIHSTTRKGVIISNLSEKYWKSAFFQARKIL